MSVRWQIRRQGILRRGALVSTVIFVFFIGFPSVAVRSNEIGGQCPSVWSEYVEQVSKIVGGKEPPIPLVFVDRDGRVYDCLSLGTDAALLNAIGIVEQALPLERTSSFSLDPAKWPANVCSVSSAIWPNAEYVSVNLPTDASILSNSICAKRVFGGVQRLVLSWEK
jgi:hypothetical protein